MTQRYPECENFALLQNSANGKVGPAVAPGSSASVNWSPETSACSDTLAALFSMEIVRLNARNCGNGTRHHVRRLYRGYAPLVLQNSLHQQIGMGNDRYPQFGEYIGCDNCVGNPGFIFKAQKDKTLSRAGLLSADDRPGDSHPRAVRQMPDLPGAPDV